MATQMRASTQVLFDAAVAYNSDPGTFAGDHQLITKKFVDDGTWKYLIQDVVSPDIGTVTATSAATYTPNSGSGAGHTETELSSTFSFTTAGAIATDTSGIPVLLEEAWGDTPPSDHGFNTTGNAVTEYFNSATVPGEYRVEILDEDNDEIIDAANSDRKVWGIWTCSARSTTEANYTFRLYSGEWNGATMTAFTMPASAFKMIYPQIVSITAMSKSSLRTGVANISAEAAAIAVGQIDNGMLAADAVDGSKIADDAVDSEHVAAGALDTEHYAANSVDTAALGADAVTGAQMADNAVNSEHITAGAVDLAHMSINSIDSDQYVDGSIDLAHMSANSVDSDQYVDGSIDLAHMSANSVDSDQYVDGSIDSAHYAAGSVDATALAAAVAGNGLSGGGGTALALDHNELTAAVVDIATDFVAIIDVTDNSTKKEAWADVIAAIAGAGLTATAGVLAADVADLSGATAAVIDPAADSFAFIDANDSDTTKKESIVDFVALLAGNGLTAASGVLSVAQSEAAEAIFAPATDFVSFLDGGTAGTLAKDAWSDIAALIAGDGLSAASGVLAMDLNELTGADIDVSADSIAFIDATDSSSKKESVADLVSGIVGAGMTATAGVANVIAGDGITVNAGDVDVNFQKDDFEGEPDDTQVVFTLTAAPVSDAMCMVFLNGVLQREGTGNDYTRVTTALTMLTAPATGDDLTVTYFG